MRRCLSPLLHALPAALGLALLCAAPVRAEVYVEAYRSPFGTARTVSTDPADGSCWVAMGSRVYHLAADGTVLWQLEGCEDISALAVDTADGSCWLLDARSPTQLIHLSSSGGELQRMDAHGAGGHTVGTNMQDALAVNPADGSLWVGGNGDVFVHLSSDGELLWSASGLGEVRSATVNPADGSCWAASVGYWDYTVGGWVGQAVVHLAEDGTELWRGTGFERPCSASVNPADGSCWVGTSGIAGEAQFVTHLAEDGTELWRSADSWGAEAVSVSPSDGSCWVTRSGNGRLVHLAEDGSELWTGGDFWYVGSLSTNPVDGSCWAASYGLGEVFHVAADGADLATVGMFGLGVQGVSLNAADRSVWVADPAGERVGHLAQDGSVLWLQEGFHGASAVAANSVDGSCWATADLGYGGTRVLHLSSSGAELWSGPVFPDPGSFPTAIAVNAADGSCCVSCYGEVAHLAEDGTVLWQTAGFEWITSVAVDSSDGSCWVADSGHYDPALGEYVSAVVHLAADGTELWRGTAFGDPRSLAVYPADGSCWVGNTRHEELVHLASDGTELLRLDVGPWPYAVAVDPRDGSCWTATDWYLKHVSPAGAIVEQGPAPGYVASGGLAVDPADGSLWMGLSSLGQVVHLLVVRTPVADFSADARTGPAPLTVNFTDLSTDDPTSWLWDFGDGGASAEQHAAHTYTTAGSYPVSLTAANAAGSDTETKSDYINVTPRTWFEDDDPAVRYTGAWSTYLHPSASAGHAAYSSQTGASAEFTFTGTGIRCQLAKGPSMGKARVYLDGGPGLLVDLYSSTLQLTTLGKLGLPPGEHTVRMEVSRRKNWRSRGYVVNLDALEVVP